jgi:hypothetical protein
MSELKKIFLQPECCVEDQDVGRMWCQDAINDCDEGNAWTEYLLASDVNQRIAELEKANNPILLRQLNYDLRIARNGLKIVKGQAHVVYQENQDLKCEVDRLKTELEKVTQ